MPALAADAPSPRMTPAVIVLTITLLLGIQPISTDLYLPALPTLQRELRHRGVITDEGSYTVELLTWIEFS